MNLLLNIFKAEDETDETTVNQLFHDTYVSQRFFIKRREAKGLKLKDVLENHWPHLTEESYFLAHSEILLGKKVQEIWHTSLGMKGPLIISYVNDYCRSYRKAKNIPLAVNSINKEFADADKAGKGLKSRMPSTLLIFPLIARKFQEIDLIVIVEPNAQDTEVQSAHDYSPSLLIVNGKLYIF
ncbi:uncharacterized protein LOC117179101 [Belonocnema kinseyi]|uniref:uncharacterized protein LOC117179101 n=1 Tax=Belonocnema kinseyi TaxID=2817044 RepID=UPI00143E068C|nr:uncharacterized protein LOC117179101 [Belonocnema kinseyi]